MRQAVLILALGLVLCALAAAAVLAQPSDAPRGGAGAVFISPFGEPFRSRPGEPYPVAAWFAGADADHDGALSPAEFRNDAARFFAVLDLDHDGSIEGPEVSVYETRVAPEVLRGQRVGQAAARIVRVQFEGADEGGGDDERKAAPPPFTEMNGASPFGLLREPEPVTASDLDFNGRITRAEFLQAADRRFRLLDADGDGRLTLAELPRTPVQQALEGGGRRGGGRHGRGGRGGWRGRD